MKKKIIIAIDGYSSTGKTTLARMLSQYLDYKHINTGAMYRAVTLYAIRNNWIDISTKCKKQVVETRDVFLEYFNIPTPCPNSWLGQMASIPLPINNAVDFKSTLLEKYNIQVPIFQWEKNIYLRYSIQAYNSVNDLEKLFAAVKELLR